MKSRRLWTCVSAAAMIAPIAGVFMGCNRGGADNSNPRSGSEGRGTPVEVARVQAETLRETVRGIGTLRAAETVEIKPEIDGIISEIHFHEGGTVQKEQLLFSIDDRKLRHQLAARRATLEMARIRRADAERRFNRMQELVERNVADRDEFDQAETDFRAATAEVGRMEAEVELVQAQLDDTRLCAPFNGIISERRVDAGDYVRAGDHLATVYRISQMEIAFMLPERFMGQVRSRQEVAVEVSAYPERRFEGEVYFVSPQVNESARDILVKATVNNQEGLLKPGAFGTAVVTLDVRERRLVIPEEALVATRTGYLVFVVEDQTAHRRDVQIGLRKAGVVEIRDGLDLGERVVRTGHMNLSDGTEVRVVEGNDELTERERGSGAEPDERP